MLKIKVPRNPWDEEKPLYNRATLELHPGITCLVGPNGSGKSSLCTLIKDWAREKKIPAMEWDNYTDGGSHAISKYGFYEDFNMVATMFMSSEGQRIVLNLSEEFRNIYKFAKENKEGIIVLDALDSGLDVFNIAEVKWVINDILNKFKENEIYVLIPANSYEMVKECDCIATKDFKHHQFQTYEAFEKFIYGGRVIGQG